jgi:hypothetical protein
MAEKRKPQINIVSNEDGMSTVGLGKRLIAVYWLAGEGWWVAVVGQPPTQFADKTAAFQWVFDQAVKFDG